MLTCIKNNLFITFVNLLNASIQRVAKRLRRVASRLGCRTSVQRDVHGVTHTFPGVGTSTPSVTASAGQSSSRNTQDTFDYGPQEIGMSQLQDAPSTQQTQPRAQRQRRPREHYTPDTDALGKGKTRSSKE